MTVAEVLKWVSENKVMTLVTVWPILSGLINMATHYQSVEAWVKFAESKPRTAHLIKLIRGLGLDPAKVARALIGFIYGRAHDVTGVKVESLPPPSADKPKLEVVDEKTPEVVITEKPTEEKPS
jgi:hypothetical protein